mmetsp:Transcript_33783/g.39123  ORF Transcript_33783/g.39123 Transcript_33783/m.39123 type:complete len:217 (+) Transcript_33783:170-820(+)|eukprot:CAMPEP_0194405230 /NCGR_PEP_ID=MMETSP0176-20130528/3622_1 /TAXON_ID=216777 /ORGANISM="Proboscia alata, Strain PI-D3" /LENGTH=216 /DNA_ID=CAMNT_0039203911 /DNA_START=153 /DNA_END=803 /DNA_ORIENTATION=-
MAEDLSEGIVAAAQKLNEFDASNKLFCLVTTEVTNPNTFYAEINFNLYERDKSSIYDSYDAATVAALEGGEFMTREPCVEAFVKLILRPKIEKLNKVLSAPKNVATRRAEDKCQDGTDKKQNSALTKSIFATALSMKDTREREHKDYVVILTDTSYNFDVVGPNVARKCVTQCLFAFEEASKLGYNTREHELEVFLVQITLQIGQKVVAVLSKAED